MPKKTERKQEQEYVGEKKTRYNRYSYQQKVKFIKLIYFGGMTIERAAKRAGINVSAAKMAKKAFIRKYPHLLQQISRETLLNCPGNSDTLKTPSMAAVESPVKQAQVKVEQISDKVTKLQEVDNGAPKLNQSSPDFYLVMLTYPQQLNCYQAIQWFYDSLEFKNWL